MIKEIGLTIPGKTSFSKGDDRALKGIQVIGKTKIDTSKALSFTGPRPKNLIGGYKIYSKGNVELGKRIRNGVLAAIENGYDTFISGSALGVDTIAFLVVDKIKRQNPELNLKNYLFIPYQDQGNNWFEVDRERLEENIKRSDGYIYTSHLHKDYPNKKVSFGQLLQFRNEVMVDYSSMVMALYTDGYRGGTHNCVEYAKKQGKKIEVIDIKDLLV